MNLLLKKISSKINADQRRDCAETINSVLYNYIPQPLIVFERISGRIISANQKACDMFNMPREDFVDSDIGRLTFPDQRSIIIETALNMQDGSTVKLENIPGMKKSGGVLFCDIEMSRPGNEGKGIIVAILTDVTDSFRKDSALKTSDKKYMQVVESLDIGIALLSPSFKILAMNRTMRKWFPHVDPALTPCCYEVMLHNEKTEKCKSCPVSRTLADGKTHKDEMTVKTGDRFRRLHVISSPVTDDNGKVTAVVQMAEDVTEKYRDKMTIKNNLELLETLIDTAPSPIYYKDRNGKYLGCNRAFLDFVGMKKNEVIGKTVFDIAPRRLAEKYHLADLELLKNGGSQVYESSLAHCDGTSREVIFYKSVFKNTDGDIVGILGIAADITEKKLAIEKLAYKQAILQSLMDSIPDLIFYKDTQGRYLGCNRAFENYTGLPQTRIVGRNDLEIFETGTAESYRNRDKDVLTQLQSISNEEVVCYPGGPKVHVETVKTPFFGPDGKPFGLVGVSRDITAHKKSRMHLKKATRLAEQANLAKSRFLAGMSHELRTPLHGIMSFSNFGLERCGSCDIEKLRHYFKKINDSAQTLMRLLNDLLDLAKLEAGKMQFVFKNCDISEVIRSVIEEFQPVLGENQIDIDFDTDRKTPPVNADPERIQQVLRNLVYNAIKFSPPRTTINITAKQQRENVEVIVSDRGKGIPPEEIESIFEKFVQSSINKNSDGGTGLGLAICAEIIKGHNGKIWAGNIQPSGAALHFTLPAAAEKETPNIQKEQQNEQQA